MAHINLLLAIDELLEEDMNLNVLVNAVEHLVEDVNVIPYEREKPIRNEHFYEFVIPNYNLDDFHSHFRMSRQTFEIILNRLQNARNYQPDFIPFDKKLLFTLWMLAQPESFRAAGDRFNMAKSTSNNIFFQTINLICGIRHEVIVWPAANRRQITSRKLEEKSGIPGIIGIIDGTHINIKAPPHNAVDYYNRNNVHSIILQGICNEKREFIDVFTGVPGRVHDARVFRMSPIFEMLSNDAIGGNEHLIGDNAYPLSAFLLKPFRDNGHLVGRQIRFNNLLSSVRSLIEQCFGLLKGKFRRLKYFDMFRIDMIPAVITAACVLHNLIIFHDDPEFENARDEVDQNQPEEVIDNELVDQGDYNGERKRNMIANNL